MCTELLLWVNLTVSHTYMTWDSGLLAQDLPLSDCGEVIEEREMTESAALSEGCKDEKDREANESAALSEGCEDEEREARESAALSEGFEDGHKDKKEREVSNSATFNEGHKT